jgi:hypothetical protein
MHKTLRNGALCGTTSFPRPPSCRLLRKHHITDRHITDRHITDRHITDRHITDFHINDRNITNCHIVVITKCRLKN